MLILQTFRHFTYVTAHSSTLPSLYLRHSASSNLSVASPTSQFILQLFFRFSYVTSPSFNSPGEPPMLTTALPVFSVRWRLTLMPMIPILVPLSNIYDCSALTFSNKKHQFPCHGGLHVLTDPTIVSKVKHIKEMTNSMEGMSVRLYGNNKKHGFSK